MANPKRKHSKARTRTRRSVYYNSVEMPPMMECPECSSTKLRHRACPTCGTYRGRKVVETREVA